MKPPILVHGMMGLGDNIHQRAVIRQLMTTYEVYLETSWVCIYHDLIKEGLHCIRKPTRLRTQRKNQEREAHLFENRPDFITRFTPSITLRYTGAMCRPHVLKAIFDSANIPSLDYEQADYRLPVPQAWFDASKKLWAEWGAYHNAKPRMIYRPLTSRPEWNGGQLRNADPAAYAELLASIRDRFFVVSIADLEPGQEWIVGPRFKADVVIEDGRLPFETLAALIASADLMFTSSGMGSILAPAVETPTISVIGGYERASWHESGAKYAPYLGIEPIKPCDCATSGCRTYGRACDKRIDIPAAIAKIRAFVTDLGILTTEACRPWTEMHEDVPSPVAAVAAAPPPVHISRVSQRQALIQQQRRAMEREMQRRGLRA